MATLIVIVLTAVLQAPLIHAAIPLDNQLTVMVAYSPPILAVAKPWNLSAFRTGTRCAFFSQIGDVMGVVRHDWKNSWCPLGSRELFGLSVAVPAAKADFIYKLTVTGDLAGTGSVSFDSLSGSDTTFSDILGGSAFNFHVSAGIWSPVDAGLG